MHCGAFVASRVENNVSVSVIINVNIQWFISQSIAFDALSTVLTASRSAMAPGLEALLYVFCIL